MKIIDPVTGWLEIVEVPCFGIDELARVNNEYIDKSSTRLIYMFNRTQLFRYPLPREFVFDNCYEFNQYFN